MQYNQVTRKTSTSTFVMPIADTSSRLYRIEHASCHLVIKYFVLESVKESGYVTKSNPTGKLLLESINVVFYHQSSPPVQSTSPVHQSSQVIVDYSSASFPCSSVCVQYDTRKRKSAKNGAYINACLVPRPSSKEESSGGSRIL